jgi:transposase
VLKLYTAFDLHANNSYVAISDEKGAKVIRKKLPNDPEVVLLFLKPYAGDMVGIVVESTFNWY